MHICNLKLLKYLLGTWQKQLMASHHNLIDFSGDENNAIQPPKTATPTTSTTVTNSVVSSSGFQNDKLNDTTQSINAAKSAGKSNKSLFEITRVETRENAGGDADDSELDMDDTVSEHNESSSTSVLDLINKQSETETKEPKLEGTQISLDPSSNNNNNNGIINTNNVNNDVSSQSSSNIAPSQQQSQSSQTATNSHVNISQHSQSTNQHHTEAPSRFRIVKIAKQKPYEKGNWMVNDFNDSQKQTESTSAEAPSSPAVRKKNPISDSGGTITSPTEPVKTKSSEFLAQAILTSQSRGSSYNTGDRRSSVESTSVIDSNSQTPFITPIMEALEGALEQIQVIKDSMIVNMTDEMKKLRDSLTASHAERNRLKEENETLKRKLTAAEERISALEQG